MLAFPEVEDYLRGSLLKVPSSRCFGRPMPPHALDIPTDSRVLFKLYGTPLD